MSRMRAEKNADLEMSVGRYWSQIALSNYAILVRNQVIICSRKVRITINCAARRVGGLTPHICFFKQTPLEASTFYTEKTA